jgi:hypothetical protein
LLLLVYFLSSLSDKPTKEEVENIVQDIEDGEQREQFIRLLTDDNARGALKGLLANVA